MSLSKLLLGAIRKIRSVLLLCVTISLLFYYTFKNEIDMLNSYAENEYLPSISNSPIEKNHEIPNLIHKPTKQISLKDPVILKEKNKYFPLLLTSASNDPTSSLLDPTAIEKSHLSYSEKYPVLFEFSLPHFNTADDSDHPAHLASDLRHLSLQEAKFEDAGSLQGNNRLKIKDLFLKSWRQKDFQISPDLWPIDLIDSLDTLYLMNESQEFNDIVERISEIDFKIPPRNMPDIIDIPDISAKLLGGLISAYDLSTNPILLTKAKNVADFILRSFDTPNRIPILQYAWKSDYNNRFPYKETSIGELSRLVLPFVRLSQITKQNRYFDAIFRIITRIERSANQVPIYSLFPNIMDASSCKVLTPEEVSTGDHQKNSAIMRSIDKDLKFVYCHQVEHFITTSNKIELDSKLISLYDMLPKLNALTNIDVHTLDSETEINSKKLYHDAMKHISSLLKFNPVHGSALNLTILSGLETSSIYSPTRNELMVQLRRNFSFNPESCNLASTLVYGQNVYKLDTENIKFAGEIIESCFRLSQEFNGLLGKLSLDPCQDESCQIDVQHKLNNIISGKYIGFDEGFGESKIIDLKGKTSEANEFDENLERTFSTVNNEHFKNIKLSASDIDLASSKWAKQPELPLWINSFQDISLLSPNIIKSMFYMYRLTGESKWRKMGATILDLTLQHLQENNNGAKGVWHISEYNSSSDEVPTYWLSQTLKYFYLLFSDTDDYSLNSFVITNSGHLMKRADTVL
ncbi:hypothetical protein KAFR_0D01000 [Kazachstania africana CBS 2517]|uniref:alpha-1,2-Mannosidase n=1 Tax=Kazachstania africana (strain ATCC 22294 / BCRC 22015 / CBS 2517 / CECT 1963 / NBRC 1671 / NRRL Y-8276) TaxID=1071382 RepID=H2ATP7_KAZAF|nr:hypothetical protein KAFR_0D01000 [Kazachstania africana CBS 2517]CCF57747.1 hypothetical protein KAFR_0D01000 [Kazachstania africana CBS 2517]